MSGHSKWSKVKHQKESTDAVKGKLFTKLTNAIIIAVRESGGLVDPESNFKLRLAIEKARSLNMPKDNIERAIEKGKGESGGEGLQQVTYEAFGPEGVAIVIEVATDNKQRTVSQLKNVLERGGGVLAGNGAISHLFQLVGLINIRKGDKTFDEVMELAINLGALDIQDDVDFIEVYSEPNKLHKLKKELESTGTFVSSAELFYKPLTTVSINSPKKAKAVLDLLSSLEDADCVQKVYANFDMPDEYLN